MPFSCRTHRFSALAATAALALTTLTACGSDGGGGGGAGGDAGSGPAEITLGVIPIIDIAPVKLGIEQGIFADHDLELTLQESQGGAAIVPGVISGDFQFGYSNLVSLLIAKGEDVPVELISVGARASDDPLDDGSGQLMTVDPALTEVEDLRGATIAVNTLLGINEVAVRATLEEHGLVRDDVTLVEVPIPNMPAALASGDVDAAMMSEPFITVTEEQGGHALPVSYAAMGANLPFAGWFAAEPYAAQNPEVVERFQAALEESLRYAEAHPDEARATLNSYLDLADGISEAVTLPGWDPTTDRAEIEHLAQLSVDAGLIADLAPLDALFTD
ncbi:ABC transporter substrate-binding protein [Streptomyces sp. DSM 44915]|uniref:ABC transporter substrate-binding protein n=1 Tax=Streptomyces chisholmiae TaxID=3075540 RepID=A0ABU2JXE1_9ACTN|nr:ABC transporter substrate-binding protein [Streptomyces sp. DSM 44915]MDT0269666.1 ABC transporter substrate-binding protein [Streptomyces sp. DSM 44915]